MVFEENYITGGTAKRLKPNASMLLIAMACYDHLPFEERPGLKEIREAIGIGKNAGYAAAKKLLELGYIAKKRPQTVTGQFGSVRYFLTDLSRVYLRNFLGSKSTDSPRTDFGEKPRTENREVDTPPRTDFREKSTPLTGNQEAVFPENLNVVSLLSNIVVDDIELSTITKEVAGNQEVAKWIIAFKQDFYLTEYLQRRLKIPQEKITEFATAFFWKKAGEKINSYKNYEAFRDHFKNWLPYYLNSNEYKDNPTAIEQQQSEVVSLAAKVWGESG